MFMNVVVGDVLGTTVPVIYVKYENKIQRVGERMRMQMRSVYERVDENEKLIQTILFNHHEKIVFFFCSSPPKFTVGLDKPLKELKQRLRGSEFVIVVSGAAGLGKTTLVKMLCNDNKVKGLDYAVPNLQDGEEALNRLQCLLEELPALVVLDDVCSATHMQFHIPECNIVVVKIIPVRRELEYARRPYCEKDSQSRWEISSCIQSVGNSVDGLQKLGIRGQ
ncbi:hypothetical protein RJ641_010299 [Dillenia turbinata]|uniref:Uncharacterized protein n=1 Tax=Dillenia turbinata TaxID=194707 RepID=A0AAN8V066_9MAGN